MNAAIRAVVRVGIARGFDVVGVRHGFTGLIAGDFLPLGARDVGGIIQQGGTILGTTRCDELKTVEGRTHALDRMRAAKVSALIVIGGNGSQTGAWQLRQSEAPVVGVASTIDNDLQGTDISIGATTAIDVALQAIDRLRVTASSHTRAFLVEVMGRDCGHLALIAGIAGGAESIVVPELDSDPEAIAAELRSAYDRGKRHAVIVVAEGARHNAATLAQYFATHGNRLGFDLRITKLGHVQRGGAPGVFDRMLGTLFGAAAVEAAAVGNWGVLIGIREGKVAATSLAEVAWRTKPADTTLLKLAGLLSI
jgi:6-phosphofructokinase 1